MKHIFIAALSTLGLICTLIAILNYCESPRIERENAFAKDCNDRGGTAVKLDGMLQCIGNQLKPKEPS